MVERPGAKIISGTAHFSTIKFTPTSSPNAQVVNWLQNWENVLGLNNENVNRASAVLKKMTTFVGSAEDVDQCKGIGANVKEVTSRSNGKQHSDWSNRFSHKKCWYQNEVQRGLKRPHVTVIRGIQIDL